LITSTRTADQLSTAKYRVRRDLPDHRPRVLSALSDLRRVASGVRGGLTFTRMGMYELLERHGSVHGTVLDLGAGRASAYLEYLDGTPERYLRADAVAETEPDYVVDLDRDVLPLDAASIDVVLAFNLLEHLYHPELVLSEARRVLRPAGLIHVWVPFLIGYHPSPEDYFRYTESTLRRKLDEAGFADIAVRSVGGRFTAAANLALYGVPTTALRVALAGAAVLLDRLYYRAAPNARRDSFPLGYLATATVG
jgi:SAM-dependent methyltransferase